MSNGRTTSDCIYLAHNTTLSSFFLLLFTIRCKKWTHTSFWGPKSGRTQILILELQKDKEKMLVLDFEKILLFSYKLQLAGRSQPCYWELGGWQARWMKWDLPRISVVVRRWAHWCVQSSQILPSGLQQITIAIFRVHCEQSLVGVHQMRQKSQQFNEKHDRTCSCN